MKTETEKFANIILEEIEPFERPEKVVSAGEPLPGISKMRSIFITKTGKLVGAILSCRQCTVGTSLPGVRAVKRKHDNMNITMLTQSN